MSITFQNSGSPGIIGAASAAAGYAAGQERRAKNAAEFAQQQQRLELAARAQQQQAYQFEAGRFDRQNALVRDEQMFLLRNEFQAERDRIADQAQLGYLDRQYQLMGERDDALFVRGLAEEAADRVNALEKELAQTPFDADGENIRRKLQESLNRIRKDTTLRPGAYLEAVSQWEDDVRRSGIQNYVKPPPDPKQLFGQWTKNEETGDFDFQPGEYSVTPWGTYVLPDGTQKSVEKSFWESLTPEAKGKMTGAPPEMFIDTRSEGASMQPIAPFTTAEGFDSAAYQKAADAIRKELSTEVYDKKLDANKTVMPPEADVQKETVRRWYAAQSMAGGPKLLLQGIARGELSTKDVQDMGFGDKLTAAVKQSVLSGELAPEQARELGFDVFVGDQGVSVRIQPKMPKMPLLWDESGPAQSPGGKRIQPAPQESLRQLGQQIQQMYSLADQVKQVTGIDLEQVPDESALQQRLAELPEAQRKQMEFPLRVIRALKNNQPVVVRSLDEAARLPSGTVFVDPNGVERRTP